MAEQKHTGGKPGYIGRIANAGTQVVEAPAQTTGKKTGTVQRGKDLRAGKR